MGISGKVVLVTGAQQGIGRAMALEFAASGADVAINWLDDGAAAAEIADLVRAHQRRAVTVQANVARIAQLRTMLEAVTQAAFGQRRKMLRQSLRSLGANTSELIEAAGLDPTARAEEVSVEQFVLLARILRDQRDRRKA